MSGHSAPEPKDKPTCGCKAPPTVFDLSSNNDSSDTRVSSQRWATGWIESPAGPIPQVATKLDRADRIGSWKARWAITRDDYTVTPGLYAVGRPSDKSEVFVTANYKMTFDRLRESLEDIDGWILVLDTKGINVWCASGKGTFGTAEIVKRIADSGLRKVVTHHRLILPQLGASGTAAHKVKEMSGFRVVYGPVYARDIKAFLDNDRKATPAMRRATFPLVERAVLIPADLVMSAKWLFLTMASLLLLSGLGPDFYSFERVATSGVTAAFLVLFAYMAGCALPSLLLPWIPGKPFAFKGALIGVLVGAVLIWLNGRWSLLANETTLIAWLLIIPAVTSFIAMNFTGSSTYTSLSGVLKEMKVALPLQLGAAVLGIGLWIGGLFV